MTSHDEQGETGEGAKTARAVGQLVKYSREVNQSETVTEVGTYALEAAFHVMDGNPSPTVVEVNENTLRVVASMSSDLDVGEEPRPIARRVYETRETLVSPGVESRVEPEVTVLDPDAEGEDESVTTVATPSTDSDDSAASGAVLVVRWSSLPVVEAHHVRPLEYLADHVATAMTNVRSRERLERARNDLEKRKEMIEVYDRLLRHDLGNDLQVIAGYAQQLRSILDEGEAADHAETIQRTAKGATDLIDRIGDTVGMLETESEPEARPLQPILEEVVEDVEAKFDSLTVEFDPAVDGQVYAGDLLDSVFTNILSNAAVHNEGPVTVRVYVEEPTPGTVVVGFADDGTGVSESVRDELFEMGKQGPDSEGSGFGLGLARALVESYGGTIELRDSDGGGADFRVQLDRT